MSTSPASLEEVLLQQLQDLPPELFRRVVFLLPEIRPSDLPGELEAQSVRAIKLIQYLRLADPSLGRLLQVLGKVAPSSPNASVSPATNAVLERLYVGGDQRPLFLNRSEQWNDLLLLSQTTEHLVVLVPGPTGQGHDYFALRILHARELRDHTLVVRVRWRESPLFPSSHASFHNALARALSCRPAELAAQLAAQLTSRNLLLLHPCICDDYEEEGLVRYYTEWLPALIEQVHAPGALKCIQPIEWARADRCQRMLSRIVRRLWPGRPAWAQDALAEDRARAMLDRLRAKSSHRLHARLLAPLSDITQKDVLSFLDRLGYTETERLGMARRVMRGAGSSEAILHGMARYLPIEEAPTQEAE